MPEVQEAEKKLLPAVLSTLEPGAFHERVAATLSQTTAMKMLAPIFAIGDNELYTETLAAAKDWEWNPPEIPKESEEGANYHRRLLWWFLRSPSSIRGTSAGRTKTDFMYQGRLYEVPERHPLL